MNLETSAGGGPAATPEDDRPTPPGRTAAVLRRVGQALAGLLLVAFVALFVYLLRLGAIPAMWMAGGGVIGLAVVAAIAIPLWRSRLPQQRVRYTVLSGLTVLGLVGCLLGYLAVGDVDHFLDRIEPPTEQVATYDVIALKAHADGIASVAGQTVGQLSIDPNRALADAALNQVVVVTYQDFTNLGTLADALIDQQVNALLLDHAYLSVYDDSRPDFEAQYKVLYSFTVVVKPGVTPSATPSATPSPTVDNNSFIVYISGIDQYGSIGVKGRSDVNILAVVNPDKGQILLVNTPRDFYVQLRGTTGLRDKLTHAGVYGIDVSVGTLEDLYGVDIDYYLRVNFDSVTQLVNLVGGIEVYSDNAFRSQGYSFQVGWNSMDGAKALVFSRERYSFAGGDRVRGQNQERVIEALIQKMVQPSQLVHFGSILDAMGGGMETSMPREAMMSLVNQQLSSGQAWTVERTSVDGDGAMSPTYTYGSQNLYVMVPDETTVAAARQRIAEILAD
ncbi:MAG: LCP family protein [Propionibacteriaceae bacterium]|jgi:LCP family protein required for cell wall assembly|nr:LCP family protein [Propionibacteriaceae bacterium]